MSKTKFGQILLFSYFQNNVSQGSNANRLYKIEYSVNYVILKFNNIYTSEQAISLEERVNLWREKLCFRTYNTMKPTKYDILLRMVCESKS